MNKKDKEMIENTIAFQIEQALILLRKHNSYKGGTDETTDAIIILERLLKNLLGKNESN